MATLGFMIEDESLTEEQSSDVHVLFLCASHMQRLVNDVLDLAKLREGSLKIRPETVNLTAQADDIISAYSSLAGVHVRFYHTISSAVPSNVHVDPLRLRQIVANGVTNALKHTTAGAVQLHVSLAFNSGETESES